MDNNIKQLLEELYQIDGSLRDRENELIKTIEGLMAIKSGIRADENFKQRLLAELATSKRHAPLSFGFTIMNKLAYSVGGAALVVALVLGYNYLGNDLSVDYGSKVTINQVGENAFGSLAGIDSSGAAYGRGAGGDAQLGSPIAMSSRPESGGGGGNASSIAPAIAPDADAKMMPWPGYTQYIYVYKGQPVEITEDRVNVLQRVTGDTIASQMNRLVGRLSFDFINLKSFNNLTVQNISLAEDREFGYSINVNSFDGSVSIYENWTKWTRAYPACNDQNCSNIQQLKPSDVPADNKIIELANQFVNEHKIDVSSYGAPEVVKNNYGIRPLAEADIQMYVPDVVQVIYPLLIDGKKVYENNQLAGLSLTVNIRVNRVSSLYGLFVNRYESSAYETEKDFNKILEVAKRGGQWGWYGDPASSYLPEGTKTVEVELGAPTMEYIKTWKQDDGAQMPKELIVPALIFPIINPPQDGYFYQTYVTVPIVKELLNIQNGGGIMPMVKEGRGGAVQTTVDTAN